MRATWGMFFALLTGCSQADPSSVVASPQALPRCEASTSSGSALRLATGNYDQVQAFQGRLLGLGTDGGAVVDVLDPATRCATRIFRRTESYLLDAFFDRDTIYVASGQNTERVRVDAVSLDGSPARTILELDFVSFDGLAVAGDRLYVFGAALRGPQQLRSVSLDGTDARVDLESVELTGRLFVGGEHLFVQELGVGTFEYDPKGKTTTMRSGPDREIVGMSATTTLESVAGLNQRIVRDRSDGHEIARTAEDDVAGPISTPTESGWILGLDGFSGLRGHFIILGPEGNRRITEQDMEFPEDMGWPRIHATDEVIYAPGWISFDEPPGIFALPRL